jgi:hypothetical protein
MPQMSPTRCNPSGGAPAGAARRSQDARRAFGCGSYGSAFRRSVPSPARGAGNEGEPGALQTIRAAERWLERQGLAGERMGELGFLEIEFALDPPPGFVGQLALAQ